MPRHEVERLIAGGVLPPGGQFGWNISECERRIRLWRDAREAGHTDEWIATADKLAALGRAAQGALDYAIAVRTADACRTADAVGDKFFSAWAFVSAVIGNNPASDPMWSREALDTARGNYTRTLSALDGMIKARIAIRFLG